MKEIWKAIKDFEGLYEVSNFGKIKSLKREVICKDGKIKHLQERILKPAQGKYGRNLYSLSKNNQKTSIKGYRIVAETFIPNPLNLPEVNHIDGNNLNDEYTNLEWVTLKENQEHAIKSGLFNTYKNR